MWTHFPPTTCPSQPTSFSKLRKNPVTSTKLNYNLAKWDLFRSIVGSAEIDAGLPDLIEVNRRIVSAILEAVREAIPMTGGGSSLPQNNLWWNKNCGKAVGVKRKMYRL